MPKKPAGPEAPREAHGSEAELQRLSEDLKAQVGQARERLADRYGKLVERRPPEPQTDQD